MTKKNYTFFPTNRIMIAKTINPKTNAIHDGSPSEVGRTPINTASATENVGNPHNLKTRRIGNHYAIELHIKMDGDITLRETHVGVHVEPYN